MPVIEVLLKVSPHIAMGLASGQLERIGGVIRDSSSKQVVAWLREGGQIQKNLDPKTALPRFLFESLLQSSNLAKAGAVAQQVEALSKLTGAVGAINNVLGAANIVATARSHHLLTLRLQAIQNMLAFSTRLGMLQLTMSGFGLLLMLKRFAEIQQLLENVHSQVAQALSQQQQQILQVNMNSALESAQVVMNSEDGHYKVSMAANLDFLLINASEHCLSDFEANRYKDGHTELELAQKSLSQAMHIDETRIRTFLEIDQINLAKSVMQERLEQHRRRTQGFVGTLLGSDNERAVFFHKTVDDAALRRYLLVEQWLRDDADILWDIVLNLRSQFWKKSIADKLMPAPGLPLVGSPSSVSTRHLEALDQAETAIENFQRFEGFALELESIKRLGISLDGWGALRKTQNTVFVNEAGTEIDEAGFNIEDHDDYALLVNRDYSDSAMRLSA